MSPNSSKVLNKIDLLFDFVLLESRNKTNCTLRGVRFSKFQKKIRKETKNVKLDGFGMIVDPAT